MNFSNFLDLLWLLARLLFGLGVLVFVVAVIAKLAREDKEGDSEKKSSDKE
jgi:hypothetical protein